MGTLAESFRSQNQGAKDEMVNWSLMVLYFHALFPFISITPAIMTWRRKDLGSTWMQSVFSLLFVKKI